MKFSKKIHPTDLEIKRAYLGKGWKLLREPQNLLTAFFSVPFMFFNGIVSNSVFSFFDHTIFQYFPSQGFSIQIRLDHFFLIYLTIFLHEIIHLILIPNFLISENTYFGIKLWGGFVITKEIISRNRFILISIAPFIILSLLLPIIFGILKILNGSFVLLGFINALASSIDILKAFLIFLQVPRNSKVVNNGFETYFLGK